MLLRWFARRAQVEESKNAVDAWEGSSLGGALRLSMARNANDFTWLGLAWYGV